MTNNTINYIEFPATDIERTKAFYSEIFEWKFEDYGPSYVSFAGAGVDGGFTTDTAVVSQGGVLVVLYFAKLEALQSKIAEYGCRISRSIFQFPGGRRFHFIDPNGNEIAVWSE